MKKNSKILLVVGVIILLAFSYVSLVNIFSKRDFSDMRFIRDINDDSAKITNIKYENGLLKIDTSNVKSICVKSTRSNPSINSICWNNISDNTFSTSIYDYKMYYIWLLDSENNMSEQIVFNPKKNQ